MVVRLFQFSHRYVSNSKKTQEISFPLRWVFNWACQLVAFASKVSRTIHEANKTTVKSIRTNWMNHFKSEIASTMEMTPNIRKINSHRYYSTNTRKNLHKKPGPDQEEKYYWRNSLTVLFSRFQCVSEQFEKCSLATR